LGRSTRAKFSPREPNRADCRIERPDAVEALRQVRGMPRSGSNFEDDGSKLRPYLRLYKPPAIHHLIPPDGCGQAFSEG
jgi:hypothetical protein